VGGLPGSKSVARAEADARNRGGPESPCRTNCEGQAGRVAQRQEVPPESPGVGSAHSIQPQGISPEAGEGADVLAKHTQATRAVRMTDPTGKPSCERRERVNTKSPVREYHPPGSVRGASGNRRPYLDKSAETGGGSGNGSRCRGRRRRTTACAKHGGEPGVSRLVLTWLSERPFERIWPNSPGPPERVIQVADEKEDERNRTRQGHGHEGVRRRRLQPENPH
jgi:hypothetical protein